MRRVIADKTIQLASYKREGLKTMLIVEWDDIALLREDLVAKAFQFAAGQASPEGFDEVYLADSSAPPTRFLPVKLGQRMFPDLSEFHDWWRKQ